MFARFKTIKSDLGAIFRMADSLRWEQHAIDLERSLLQSTGPGLSSGPVTDRELVVSLTTYGKRLEQVHLTIESLLLQTLPPNRIVLWLDESMQGRRLPAALIRQQERGLEIRYTEDLRSYKKLIPALAAFPEANIITADDDLIYDPCMVDRLVRAHEMHPGCVTTTAALELESDSDFSRRHLTVLADREAMNLLPLGGTGTLYPPGALHPEVMNMEAVRRLCPLADDIWFRAMGLMNSTPVVKVVTDRPDGWDIIMNDRVQDTALWHDNVSDRRNETQYAAVMKAYGLTLKTPGKVS